MKLLLSLFAISILAYSPPSSAQTSYMRNILSTTGEGAVNPSYGKQVKNILIFQAGGWSQLPSLQDSGQRDPSWPLPNANLDGGRIGYLSKSRPAFLSQMSLIKQMSGTTAIAQLIMPDEEAAAGQYGTCFNGKWISTMSCTAGGTWKTPKAVFADVRWAAWMKGIQVAPFFSINVYDKSNQANRAQFVVDRLKSLVDWYFATSIDAVTLRSVDGKVVILTEGLPSNTNLANDSIAQKALVDYMNSRTDILWIDNLAVTSPSAAGANIYRSAATFDRTGQVQDSLKASWGNRYLWHFLDRYGMRRQDMRDYANKIPETIRAKWLNRAPYDPNAYPVIISQWNEYAEFLTFEPDEADGYDEYNYLKQALGYQQ